MSHTESSAQRGAWRERCVFEDKKTEGQLIKSQTEETNNTICQKTGCLPQLLIPRVNKVTLDSKNNTADRFLCHNSWSISCLSVKKRKLKTEKLTKSNTKNLPRMRGSAL